MRKSDFLDVQNADYFTLRWQWNIEMLHYEINSSKKMILDQYNINDPNAEIPEETFDESDEITEWKGGSSTFSIDDDDDEPVSTIKVENLPESEEL